MDMKSVLPRPLCPALLLIVVMSGVAFTLPVVAQEAKTIVSSSTNINIGQEQMQMLQAVQYVIQGELGKAEALYGQVIGQNPKNLQAYIQRSITRREMRNVKGMEADAVEVLNITQMELQARPNDAQLYYSRGMAYRILKDYAKARNDIEHALQLSPENTSWKEDLKAITLEEKML